jgi:thiol-disulfide isomerase/thioredoxin
MKKGILKERWNKYRKRKRWWSILFDFIFLVLIVGMLIPQSRKNISSFVVRQTLLAPRESSNTFILGKDDWDMKLQDREGRLVTLSDFRGKPIFINYWASWCPPCVAEMPSISNLYDKYKDSVNFIFISTESHIDAAKYLEKNSYDFPVYTTAGEIPEALITSTIPTTILISKGGNLVMYKTGAARWDSRNAYKIIDRLLSEI